MAQTAAQLVADIDGALAGMSNRLDSAVRGLSWKQSVRAASTGNVTRTAPQATLDGVTLPNPSRVLLKDQSIASENGIYVYAGTGTALVRAADADSSDELTGAAVTVVDGTVNKGSVWVQSTTAVIIGATAITWSELGGAAGVVVDPYMPTIE